MNKALSIFLIGLILLVNSMFILFNQYVSIQKKQFRQESLISGQDHCQEILLNEGDLYRDKPGFEWKEHNRELLIDGKYFEVLKVEHVASGVIVLLIPDVQENLLFASYFQKQKQRNNHLLFSLISLFGMQYVHAVNEAEAFTGFESQNYLYVPDQRTCRPCTTDLLKPPASQANA
ncbi:MAG TPA: hypothetical protein PLQ93_06200 [Bacteroidia bacterium]|nr:hypothetical protein [Bacteroidia bacterium]